MSRGRGQVLVGVAMCLWASASRPPPFSVGVRPSRPRLLTLDPGMDSYPEPPGWAGFAPTTVWRPAGRRVARDPGFRTQEEEQREGLVLAEAPPLELGSSRRFTGAGSAALQLHSMVWLLPRVPTRWGTYKNLLQPIRLELH